MSKSESALPKAIWADDLLGREEEAEQLATYIRCVAARNVRREDSHAYTIAVDADYGVGKTFFLKRFRDHISSRHPVALVDAWSDDLSDEPLTAVAATLKVALAPLIKKPNGKKAWQRVTQATGAVAKIAAMGLAQRALAAMFTAAGAELLTQTLKDLGKGGADLSAEMEALAGEAADGAVQEFMQAPPSTLMDERIAQFAEGRAAVEELKEGLRSLLKQLPAGKLEAPIVIIIDELDRCRPNYAIKLLEEIKHLFDVQGLVFVLGINRAQLAQAVRGAYGLRFDGDAYLRKFINRDFKLRTPDASALLEQLLQDAAIPADKLHYPPTSYIDSKNPIPALLAEYMDVYGATARDAFQIVDKLQTCAALTGSVPLLLPYIVPLIIGDVRTGKKQLPLGVKPDTLFYSFYRVGNHEQVGLQQLAGNFDRAAKIPARDLMRKYNNEDVTFAEQDVVQMRSLADRMKLPLADPQKYPRLLEAVGSFDTRSPG